MYNATAEPCGHGTRYLDVHGLTIGAWYPDTGYGWTRDGQTWCSHSAFRIRVQIIADRAAQGPSPQFIGW